MVVAMVSMAQILSAYIKAWPNSSIDTEGLAFYGKILQSEYSTEQVAYAMNKLVRTNKFFPSIAEIIAVIKAREKEIAIARLAPDYRGMSVKQIQSAVAGSENKRKLLQKGANDDGDYWGIISSPIEQRE